MLEIKPYQPQWPQEFALLGAQLRRQCGALALRIDHIGSTAVPHLPAKDIIDIQITAAELHPALQEALLAGGWSRARHVSDHLPPGADPDPQQWTKWLFKQPDGQRSVNLHVRIDGRANQQYPLLFRDYLRAFPAAAQAYALVKQALARNHPEDDLTIYYEVKDPVCDIIAAAAQFWAQTTAWSPGPSDC